MTFCLKTIWFGPYLIYENPSQLCLFCEIENHSLPKKNEKSKYLFPHDKTLAREDMF